MSENSLALIKKDTIDVVATKIRQFQQSGELHLPANYSAENTMKSAWLILQGTVDKNGKPVLETCTKDSIANALLDMVVQGLNPAKKQCYFVPYGNKLICMRSYFGSMALVKRIFPEADIWYGVVYKGDEFEYTIERGRKKIIKHVQKIENVKPENILAAYCVIEPGRGRPPYTEIMTIDQIKQAWMQGISYKEGNEKGIHQKFTDQMAIKTVVNRVCKYIINSSSDDYLLLYHFNRTDEEIAEAELEKIIEAEANSEIIDVEPNVVENEDNGLKPEPQRREAVNKKSVKSEQLEIGPGF